VFVHVPLHFVPLFGHEQPPFAHVSPPVQATPQAPQLFGSLEASTQAPLQSVRPAGQDASWHIPRAQAAPVAQVTLHAPQLPELAWVSTQAPLQDVWPEGQAH
jgi:hypothetical protein